MVTLEHGIQLDLYWLADVMNLKKKKMFSRITMCVHNVLIEINFEMPLQDVYFSHSLMNSQSVID